ncbi:MAG: protein kinase domain-containing protein [Nocardioides sp.]
MQPELIGGRYRVLRAIGQGGMGTVWLCRDETLAREVAVKQVGLLPGASVTDSARALREARSSAALAHRNVVTVFDIVEEDESVWMVMEHVPSRTLSELIRDEGRLAPDRVAAIGAQVADGLASAHAKGTIHRDVKPGNILVRDDGVAKIGDFGLARTAGDPTLTQSGLVTGTPSYFSPELARGADPGPASDVWGLGAALYAAVEGRPPYRAQTNPMAVLSEIAQQQPAPPKSAAFLEPTLQRMLDRDPQTRWSMADAAHSLHRLATSHTERTITATDEPPPRPVWNRDGALRGVAPAAAAAPAVTPVEDGYAADDIDDDEDAGYTDDTGDTWGGGRDGRKGGSKRGLWYAALVGAAVLLVIGGVALLSTLREDPGANTAASSDPTSSTETEPEPSDGTTAEPSDEAADVEPTLTETPSPTRTKSPKPPRATPSPTPSRTPTPSPTPTRTAAPASDSSAQIAFLQSYYQTAPVDQDAGWAQLSPAYQNATGRTSYDAFWGDQVESAVVSDPSPVPGQDAVDLTIRYVNDAGDVSTERHRLSLVRSGDGYLINGYD